MWALKAWLRRFAMHDRASADETTDSLLVIDDQSLWWVGFSPAGVAGWRLVADNHKCPPPDLVSWLAERPPLPLLVVSALEECEHHHHLPEALSPCRGAFALARIMGRPWVASDRYLLQRGRHRWLSESFTVLHVPPPRMAQQWLQHLQLRGVRIDHVFSPGTLLTANANMPAVLHVVQGEIEDRHVLVDGTRLLAIRTAVPTAQCATSAEAAVDNTLHRINAALNHRDIAVRVLSAGPDQGADEISDPADDATMTRPPADVQALVTQYVGCSQHERRALKWLPDWAAMSAASRTSRLVGVLAGWYRQSGLPVMLLALLWLLFLAMEQLPVYLDQGKRLATLQADNAASLEHLLAIDVGHERTSDAIEQFERLQRAGFSSTAVPMRAAAALLSQGPTLSLDELTFFPVPADSELSDSGTGAVSLRALSPLFPFAVDQIVQLELAGRVSGAEEVSVSQAQFESWLDELDTDAHVLARQVLEEPVDAWSKRDELNDRASNPEARYRIRLLVNTERFVEP